MKLQVFNVKLKVKFCYGLNHETADIVTNKIYYFQVLLISTLFFNWVLSENVVPSVENKTPFELDEYLNFTFRNKGWNGTWISGKLLTFLEKFNMD